MGLKIKSNFIFIGYYSFYKYYHLSNGEIVPLYVGRCFEEFYHKVVMPKMNVF